MDGEQTNFYNDRYHARSLDSELTNIMKLKESRAWCKSLWAKIKTDIPKNMRICGENLYAVHSIYYDNLKSYFQVFNIWEDDTILSFDDTVMWCELLGLTHVPIIKKFIWNDAVAKDICAAINTTKTEGIVFRPNMSINVSDFSKYYFKWVRTNHVQTNEHWMYSKLELNRLKDKT